MSESQILYHYTDIRGLLGILGRNAIWATDARFLNDATELEQAAKVVGDLLENANAAEADEGSGKLRGDLESAAYLYEMLGYLANSPYVFSLSEEPDLLSQWRAYGGQAGYALGFEVYRVDEHPEVRLLRCLYDEEEQRSEIREALARHADPSEQTQLDAGLSAALSSFRAYFKHPSFGEEREHRLVFNPAYRYLAQVDCNVRDGGSVPIPYLEVPLETVGLTLVLQEVVLGPQPTPGLAMAAIRQLLKKDVELRTSATPFRAF